MALKIKLQKMFDSWVWIFLKKKRFVFSYFKYFLDYMNNIVAQFKIIQRAVVRKPSNWVADDWKRCKQSFLYKHQLLCETFVVLKKKSNLVVGTQSSAVSESMNEKQL